MANTLTWRDVAAPDFSTALRGIGVAGQNASQGFDTLDKALGDFQTYRQGQAANAVLNNAVGFTDPTALRAAIADGSLFNGIDRSLVTPQALAALNSQPGVLLDQATGQERLTHAQQLDPLLVDAQKGLNTHQDLANAYAAAANPILVQGLRLDNTGKSLENSGKAIANQYATDANPRRLAGLDLANATTQQALDQSNTTFQRGTDAYTAQQDAINFLNPLKNTINGPEDVQNIYASPAFKSLSPMAQQHVQSELSSSIGSIGSGGGASRAIAGAAGAPGTQPGTAAASPYTAVPGYMAQPGDPDVTTMKIGDVQNFQTNTLLKRSPGPGMEPASSVGAFQINRDTLTQYAPKALGADWKNQTLTPENQDKIAKAIFEDNKDGNLQSQWSSLPDARPGAYANKTWDQMRPVIMAGETRDVTGVNQEIYNLGRDRASLGAQASNATKAINLALSQTNADNINSKYVDTQQDQSTVGDVVSKMTGPNSTSAYKDLPVSRLVNEINRVKELVPGTTAATAARLLEEHPQGADWFDRIRPGFLGGHATIPNVGAVDTEAKAINTNVTVKADQANQQALASSALISQAQQVHADASDELNRALHNPSTTPKQLAGLRNKVAIARAILESRLQSQSQDPTLAFAPNQISTGEQVGGATTPNAGAVVKTRNNPQGLPPALTDTPANAPAVRVSAPASKAITAAVTPSIASPVAYPPGSAAAVDARRRAMLGLAADAPINIPTVNDPNSSDPLAIVRAHQQARRQALLSPLLTTSN